MPAAQYLSLALANRHGLIAGATGTGKTVTLQILAEGFSRAGAAVFMADVKGDLSGLCQACSAHEKLSERAATIGLDDYALAARPTVFWDLYGEKGHPTRGTISNMGPQLLSQLLQLNETQEGVPNIVFRIAENDGWLLLDPKDLRSMRVFLGENSKTISVEFGNVSKASIGALQRRLLTLENEGANEFWRTCISAYRPYAHHLRRTGVYQNSVSRTVDVEPKTTARLCCSYCLSCSMNFQKSVIRTRLSWCSSSTKHTCCLTMRLKHWLSGSNKRFG